MGLRCYYRAGGNEQVGDIKCETLVTDEANEESLRMEGWRRSPAELLEEPAEEEDDEILMTLRNAAKERGIRGWQRMGEAKLRESLGLNDGNDEE